MATRKTTAKPKNETQVNENSESVTLEQALKEEGEGRSLEKQDKVLTKMEKATKIMEEMWNDIQSGKVKRKDVIKRFMEEVPLSKAGVPHIMAP